MRLFPFFKLPRRLKAGQLVYFSRQLYIMLRSGIPIVRALNTLAAQSNDKQMSKIIAFLALQVEQGEPLSEAMRHFPEAFPEYYVNMVKAAELGGVLEEIFNRLAVMLEKQYRTRKKVISAFVYPAFVLGVAFLIITLIMIFVVPTFMKMFAEYEEALPLPTTILIGISSLLKTYWWLVLVAVFCVIGVFKLAMRNYRFRYFVHKMFLSFPVIGELLKKFYIGRFAHTFGTLMASGVPVLQAITVVKETINSEPVKAILQRLYFLVEEGESMSPFLKAQTHVFPPLVVEMINIGEETGSLSSMLTQIADTYDEEIDILVGSLTSLIEPLLIVVMGLAVGFIVVSMFLPLFSLTQFMSR